MIEIGKYNTLIILRDTKVGFFLVRQRLILKEYTIYFYPINMSQMNLK
jgi:hypothetical protein